MDITKQTTSGLTFIAQSTRRHVRMATTTKNTHVTCHTHDLYEEYCRNETSHGQFSRVCVFATRITGNASLAASLRLWTLCAHSCTAIKPRAKPTAYAHCAKTERSDVGALVLALVCRPHVGAFVLLVVCRQWPTRSACPSWP